MMYANVQENYAKKNRYSPPLLCFILTSFLLTASYTTNLEAAVDSAFVLPQGEWHQVVVPATLSPRNINGIDQNTIAAVFGDDLDVSTYKKDWILYEYKSSGNSAEYRTPLLDERIRPGIAYWIIQISNSPITIDLPESASRTTGIDDRSCDRNGGVSCIRVSLTNSWPAELTEGFSMVGSPSTNALSGNDIRIATTDSAKPCPVDYNQIEFQPCNLEQADQSQLVKKIGYRYDNSLAVPAYTEIDANSTINPWLGFWLASTNNRGVVRYMSIPADEPLDFFCPCLFDETLGLNFFDVIENGGSIINASADYTESDTRELEQVGLTISVAPNTLTVSELRQQVPDSVTGFADEDLVDTLISETNYDNETDTMPGSCSVSVKIRDVNTGVVSSAIVTESATIPNDGGANPASIDTAVHTAKNCASYILNYLSPAVSVM